MKECDELLRKMEETNIHINCYFSLDNGSLYFNLVKASPGSADWTKHISKKVN